MNIVYLIGNGFDLNLGMKTSYTDFYNYYLSLPRDNDNNAIKRFKRKLAKNFNNWSDLEYALGTKYLRIINVKDAVGIHKHITMHLPKYLAEEEGRHVIQESQEKLINYLCEPYSGNWLLSQEIEEIEKYMSTYKQETCNKAVKLVDNDPDVWLLLAQVNGRLNKVDAELVAYKKYVTLNPNDLTARRRIGEIYYGKKQWSDVITNTEMFLANNDKDVKMLNILIDAYVATNQQQKAIEFLTKAKSLKNKDPDVRERLYKIYKQEGEKELAETELRELVNMIKDNKHRLMLCGDLVEAGKLDEAANVANEVKKSDPTNRDGLMALAGIQMMQKKYNEAIETYKLVLFADNTYAPACAGRAEAHFLLADYDRAETYYKKALEYAPKMASAELGLSKVYKATKQKDLQVQHLNRAKLLDPSNKAVQDELRQLK